MEVRSVPAQRKTAFARDAVVFNHGGFEALDEHRDTEITPEMIRATRGLCVVAQWLIRDARDLGLELERLDRAE